MDINNFKESAIQIPDLIVRGVYKIFSRNINYGVYVGPPSHGFVGIREKFGSLYLFREIHYSASVNYGTVYPQKLICMLPDDINPYEHIEHSFSTKWGSGLWSEGRPVLRRDLKEDETPHGARQGFVDEYEDGTRLPDKTYPHFLANGLLFNWLKKIEAEKP